MNRFGGIFISLLLSLLTPGHSYAMEDENSDLNTLLDQLDSEIKKAPYYISEKEKRIQLLNNNIAGIKDARLKSNLEWQLFNEYRNFQSDSAFSHIFSLYNIAERANLPEEKILGLTGLADYYNSIGYYKEASEIISTLSSDSIPENVLPFFLDLTYRLYDNLSSQPSVPEVVKEEYNRRKYNVLDSLVAKNELFSYPHDAAFIELKKMEGLKPQEEIEQRKNLFSKFNLGDYEKARQYSLMGLAALENNDDKTAKKYFILSAIHDIRDNNRSATSIQNLAELFESEGEHTKAYNYIKLANEDAEAFNSPARLNNTVPLLLNLERKRFFWKNPVFSYIILILFFVFLSLSIYLSILFIGKNRKIKNAYKYIVRNREELRQFDRELDEMDRDIHELLSKLKETTEIKDTFIKQAIKGNLTFANSMEEKLKEISRLIKDKKYDKVNSAINKSGIREERQRVFKSFDEAFLHLFPNFLDGINKLLPEGYKTGLDANGELPMDVRIFALTRLGISDPAEIANFLNLSVKTVYVYKTKMKSRSLVENNVFEEEIMKIEKPEIE